MPHTTTDTQIHAGLSGDPFADVGAAVLQKLLAQNPGWQEQDALKFATDVYVRDWQGKLASFFSNSAISNPAKSGKIKEQTDGTLKYYGKILNSEGTLNKGWCRITGKYEPLFASGRENQVLVGSGSFINFHHGLEGGLRLGKEALLNIFFSPLGCVYVDNKIALVQSNRPEVTRLIANLNLQENRRLTNALLKPGMAKSRFGNPANALFGYISTMLDEAAEEMESIGAGVPPALTLYHFTNFGPTPDLVLYHLSATVFEFYREMQSRPDRAAWQWFVRGHYRNGKAEYRGVRAAPDTDTLVGPPAKANEPDSVVKPLIYQAWTNVVYIRLLNGQRLLRLMRDWARFQTFPFSIVIYYCQKLLDMERKTLDLLAKLARYLVTDTDEKTIKRSLGLLTGARSAHDVRQLLVVLQRNHYKAHKDESKPLLTLEDYARYLFPEGANWRNTRDLLLLAVYEQLHEQNLDIEDDADPVFAAVADDTETNDEY